MKTFKVDLTELDKLEAYLKENGIPYERRDEEGQYIELVDAYVNDRHQICVPKFGEGYEWDAICHYGSYGYKQGLLEVYGALCIENNHNPIGWLTAEQVEELVEKWKGGDPD